MDYLDARRLTGPNLLWDEAGSILDVGCTPDEVASVAEVWKHCVKEMLAAVGWQSERLCTKALTGGVSLAFSAPIDALYAATEINEYAWTVIVANAAGSEPPSQDEAVQRIRAEIDAEINPPLLALKTEARRRGVAFLWDDDEVSVGLGHGSRCWPFRELPAPEQVPWSSVHDLPVALVTGTNGKTTTVRIATQIARAAGHRVGVSSTDWIAVDERIIDRGDWSGPGGARSVLRQDEVTLAILEAARGGLLRRGLGVERATAALITNIAEDHLGDFGSRSLEELLDVKWIVSHAVRKEGDLVLNADDPLLVAKAADYPGTIVWFSLTADSPVVMAHLKTGGTAFVLQGDDLVRLEGSSSQALCRAQDIPIALDGAARHNIANALAAAALTASLGVPLADIRRGLTGMTQADNPGRCNVYDVGGAKLLVDFAHNPAAMQSLFDMATALPAERRILLFGQAGDRPDGLIRDLARGAFSIGLDAVVVSELAQYHRGRDHKEVFAIIRDELVRCGASKDVIHHREDELASLDFALEWAKPGDLIIMLDLGRDPAVAARIDEVSSE